MEFDLIKNGKMFSRAVESSKDCDIDLMINMYNELYITFERLLTELNENDYFNIEKFIDYLHLNYDSTTYENIEDILYYYRKFKESDRPWEKISY